MHKINVRQQSLGALAVFAVAFLLGFVFYSRHPLLYDADSYYHLTVARAFAHEGLLHDLPWVRFSLMHQGFGDKELLFHVLLAPFAALPDPLLGGRLALALLDALVLAILGHLAVRAVGWWGLLVPFGLVLGSQEFAWRMVRLRPELLSLAILLAALWAVARGRYRWLGALAALYTLSYTAFHAFVGLCVILFLFFGWVRRRWEPGLVLYPLLGAGLGLVLHPQFPKNLEVWVAQSINVFARQGAVDKGTELRPNFTDVVLMVNLGWFLGLAALWRSGAARPAGGRRRDARRGRLRRGHGRVRRAVHRDVALLDLRLPVRHAVDPVRAAAARAGPGPVGGPRRRQADPHGRGPGPGRPRQPARRGAGAADVRQPDGSGAGPRPAAGPGSPGPGAAARGPRGGAVAVHAGLHVRGAVGPLPERARPGLHGRPLSAPLRGTAHPFRRLRARPAAGRRRGP